MLRKLLLLAVLPLVLYPDETRLHDYSPEVEAWLTGPLLTPSGVVVQKGHINVEPYLYITANTSAYNNDWKAVSAPTFWNISSQLPVQVGISQWADLEITPTLTWNKQSHLTGWALGDLVVQLDFQLLLDPVPSDSVWRPSVRFTLMETAPIGKYRNLSPLKAKEEVGGLGSWNTSMQLGISKVYRFGAHFFVYRANLQYDIYPAPVHVKGFHAYGGGFGTNGTVYPGRGGLFDVGFEYTLNQHWVLAMDVDAKWTAKNRFSGVQGSQANGVPAQNVQPMNIQYSLAPALEYNFSQNLGVIAGVWFTVAGKNAPKFASGVIAMNYYQ